MQNIMGILGQDFKQDVKKYLLVYFFFTLHERILLFSKVNLLYPSWDIHKTQLC